MLTASDIPKLEAFMARTIGTPRVRIENVVRIHGGASLQTYSFDATYGQHKRGFILRRDPPDSLIDTDRALEYAAYNSVQGRDVPAPKPVALVTDSKVLGAPFFVMERVDNCTAGSPFNPNAFGDHREAIGRDFFAILGRIARINPDETELAQVCISPAYEDCWKRELDHWANIIAQDALEPQPIAEAAIRRLRANPPPAPRRLSIVHGDYRVGNFLHDGTGSIKAVLDWEMAHIGDPMEDIAWALDPLWSGARKDLAAGMIPMGKAIEIWEDNADQDFDVERYRWWSIFASLKGLAIWISSGRTLQDGKNYDPVLAFSGWYCLTRHNQILAERLAAAPRGLI